MSTTSKASYFCTIGASGHLLGMSACLKAGWGLVTMKHLRRRFSDSQSIVDYSSTIHQLQLYLVGLVARFQPFLIVHQHFITVVRLAIT